MTAAGRFLSALLVFAGVMAGIMIAVGIGDLVGFEQLDLAEAGIAQLVEAQKAAVS